MGLNEKNNITVFSTDIHGDVVFIWNIVWLKTSSARPLRSLAEWRSGVPPTSVRLRLRSAELPLERNVLRFKSCRFFAPAIPLNFAIR